MEEVVEEPKSSMETVCLRLPRFHRPNSSIHKRSTLCSSSCLPAPTELLAGVIWPACKPWPKTSRWSLGQIRDGLAPGRRPQIAKFLAWQIESAFRAGLAGTVLFSYTDDWFRGGRQIDDWGFGVTTRDRQPKGPFAAVAQQHRGRRPTSRCRASQSLGRRWPATMGRAHLRRAWIRS